MTQQGQPLKLDMELVRGLLAFIAEHCNDSSPTLVPKHDKYSRELIIYHLGIMHERDLFNGSEYDGGHWGLRSLTEKGQNFYQAIQDDTVWNRVKEQAGPYFNTLSFEEVKELSAQVKRQEFEQRRVGGSERLPETITVLFVAANPDAENALELDEEMRVIRQRIRASRHRDAIRIEACWAARAADLLQALNEYRPHIVHFSGHGSEDGELVFKRDNGESQLVFHEAIAQTFATAGNAELCLGIFNACFSEAQAQAVTKHIPMAIGMSVAVGDAAAREFAAQFYSALGFGLSVEQAFGQGKAAMMLEDVDERNTPQLFVGVGINPKDVVLVRSPDD